MGGLWEFCKIWLAVYLAVSALQLASGTDGEAIDGVGEGIIVMGESKMSTNNSIPDNEEGDISIMFENIIGAGELVRSENFALSQNNRGDGGEGEEIPGDVKTTPTNVVGGEEGAEILDGLAQRVRGLSAADTFDALYSGLVQESSKYKNNVVDARVCGRRGVPVDLMDEAELKTLQQMTTEDVEIWRNMFVDRLTKRLTVNGSEDQVLEACDWLSICNSEFISAVPVVRSSLVGEINKKGEVGQLQWEAEESEYFKGMTRREAKKLMGTVFGPKAIMLPPKKHPAKVEGKLQSSEPLPESFDSREAFPFCKDTIGHVRDQSNCGSCWAFASTEAFNDRLCIASKGEFKSLLSPQHTTSCCSVLRCLSLGCNGGHPAMAWRWFKSEGVVTGGDFDDLGSGSSCWPYEFPACSHHVNSPLPKCESGKLPSTPKCRHSCEETKYTANFLSDKHHAKNIYRLSAREEIQRDIMQHGPVSAAFMVFEDFVNYKSGVYKHVDGSPLGGHAIKIIGWGTENETPYWLAVNSWNTFWGDNGLFKIAMGDVGIEDLIFGGEISWPHEQTSEDNSADVEDKVEYAVELR